MNDSTKGKSGFKTGHLKVGGRKPGSPNKATIKLRGIQQRLVIDGNTPLEYLAALMTNNKVSPDRRDRAAIAMMPFMHAKMQPKPATDARAPGEVAQEIRQALAAMRNATATPLTEGEPSEPPSSSSPQAPPTIN